MPFEQVTCHCKTVAFSQHSGILLKSLIEGAAILAKNIWKRGIGCRRICSINRKIGHDGNNVELGVKALRQFYGRRECSLCLWRLVVSDDDLLKHERTLSCGLVALFVQKVAGIVL